MTYFRYTWIPESDNSCIAGIPMPPQNTNVEVPTPRDDQTAAWEKAQEALKKVNVSATSISSNISSMTSYHSQPQPDIRSQALHYYPWMEQHGLGIPPFLPRLPPPPPPPPPPSSSSSLSSSLPPPPPPQTYGMMQENSAYVGVHYGFTPSGTHLSSSNSGYHPDFMSPWASSNVASRPRQFGFNGNRSTSLSGPGGEYDRNNSAAQHPIRFSINRSRGLNTAPAFHENTQSFGLESPSIPDPVK